MTRTPPATPDGCPAAPDRDAAATLERLAALGAAALDAHVSILGAHAVHGAPADGEAARLAARRCEQVAGGGAAEGVEGELAWAGVRVARGEGTPVALCAVRPAGRPWSPDERATLRCLASAVAVEIEVRAELLECARKESELRESEQRFRALFEGSPLPKWVFDLDTLRFLDVNEAMVKRYGYSRDEFLAMSILDIRPPEDMPRLRAALARGVGRRARYTGALHRTRDGAVFTVDTTAQEIAFHGRRAAAVVALDVDAHRPAGGTPPRDADALLFHPEPDGVHAGAGRPSPLGRMREQLATAFHLGHVAPGDRLPSIRQAARRLATAPHEIVRAYRALAADGYLEKRSRSGVYMAPQGKRRDAPAGDTTEWLLQVLTGAFEHQVGIPTLPEFIRRRTSATPLRAACIAGDHDTRVGLCTEISRQFGVGADPIPPGALADELPRAVRDADLLVCTAFHAPDARRVAEALGIPLVVVTLNPEHVEAVERRAREREVTVVCVDPRFGETLRGMRGGRCRDRIRVVLADDREALAARDPEEPVFVTRAAHERLRGAGFRLLVPFSPFLSPASARALCEVLVELNTGVGAG
jgi:PAS domain S-box-containing protein